MGSGGVGVRAEQRQQRRTGGGGGPRPKHALVYARCRQPAGKWGGKGVGVGGGKNRAAGGLGVRAGQGPGAWGWGWREGRSVEKGGARGLGLGMGRVTEGQRGPSNQHHCNGANLHVPQSRGVEVWGSGQSCGGGGLRFAGEAGGWGGKGDNCRPLDNASLYTQYRQQWAGGWGWGGGTRAEQRMTAGRPP